MFRFWKPQRSIQSISRLPLRLEAQRQRAQLQNVQKVRFTKPGTRPRTVIISFLAIYIGWNVYYKLVLDPLERAATEVVDHLPEPEEEPKPIFIPFPGTTKQLKPVPYRGSDPEWQEFIKFSKDQARAKRVRDELAMFVRGVADRHPVLVMRCGTGMKLRRYWLDVDFPTHPPPEFERSGIEIADEYIAWSTMPVDSLTVFRIRQAFWPSALAQSFWSFTKVMVTDDAKRVARILGLHTGPPPPSLEQILARHQELMKGGPPPTKDGPQKTPRPLGDAKKAMIPTQVPEKSSVTDGKGSEEVDVGPGTRAAMASHAHFFRAITAFKLKLQQTWKPAPNYPPRGSILVSGLVEIDSPKAWLVFDVKAAWDPKTKSYDGRSMHLQLRRMQMKKQGPLGGA